jgi:hypothetical protein
MMRAIAAVRQATVDAKVAFESTYRRLNGVPMHLRGAGYEVVRHLDARGGVKAPLVELRRKVGTLTETRFERTDTAPGAGKVPVMVLRSGYMSLNASQHPTGKKLPMVLNLGEPVVDARGQFRVSATVHTIGFQSFELVHTAGPDIGSNHFVGVAQGHKLTVVANVQTGEVLHGFWTKEAMTPGSGLVHFQKA